MEHILIIGGGIGGAIAHDLAQRGYRVTLFEKGELLSGSTGRHHGLLHSGARYALHDLQAARECMTENRILRAIVPQALEQNDGLFVALNDEDMAYRRPFIEKCRAAGIPATELSLSQARRLEPRLSPSVQGAVQVPDAAMDAWRLALSFFASARLNGADIRPFSEVVGILTHGGVIKGVEVFNHRTHKTDTIRGDMVVNAAGPWAAKIAGLIGIRLPLQAAPGVMVSLGQRLTNMVINRLHPAADGDIIVPQRNLSLLGTTVWLADDPDRVKLPWDHVQRVIDLCAQMVPQIRQTPVHAAWCASRPLIVTEPGQDPAGISRTFECVDHAAADGIEGFVSILGGKATTMRAMAEKTADLIGAKTGRSVACRTHLTKLAHYRRFYREG